MMRALQERTLCNQQYVLSLYGDRLLLLLQLDAMPHRKSEPLDFSSTLISDLFRLPPTDNVANSSDESRLTFQLSHLNKLEFSDISLITATERFPVTFPLILSPVHVLSPDILIVIVESPLDSTKSSPDEISPLDSRSKLTPSLTKEIFLQTGEIE